jgi:hypothetical protein
MPRHIAEDFLILKRKLNVNELRQSYSRKGSSRNPFLFSQMLWQIDE